MALLRTWASHPLCSGSRHFPSITPHGPQIQPQTSCLMSSQEAASPSRQALVRVGHILESVLTKFSDTVSPISGTRPRYYPEKSSLSKLRTGSVTSDRDASSQCKQFTSLRRTTHSHTAVPQASIVSVAQPQQTVSPVAMSAEVVENLWQEFAQRIDRGPPPRKSGVTIAPPKYPSSIPR